MLPAGRTNRFRPTAGCSAARFAIRITTPTSGCGASGAGSPQTEKGMCEVSSEDGGEFRVGLCAYAHSKDWNYVAGEFLGVSVAYVVY